MGELEELCQQYTSLSEADINVLVEQTKQIEQARAYRGFDVFIDVRNEFNNQAVVVYHKLPVEGLSLYRRKVIGKAALRTNEPGVFHTLETQLTSVGLLAETQEKRLIRQKIYPIVSGERTIGVTIVEADVSRDVLESFQSENTRSRYTDVSATIKMFGRFDSAITDQLADAILGFDQTGRLILANRTAIALYKKVGYIGNILGLDYENLSLDGSRFHDVLKALQKVKTNHRPITTDFNYVNYFFTVRKFWNEKNQQRRLHGIEAKQALDESISRIMAISSTYELMSKQLDDYTNLQSALNLLVAHFKQLSDDSHELTVNLNVDPKITVDSEQVVTVSIIVNELLQNVISHAYPRIENRVRQVTIEGIVNQGIITIRVADNGVGFDVNQTHAGSLGLTIIRSYVKDKLLGRLKIESSSRGTDISFSFDQKTRH